MPPAKVVEVKHKDGTLAFKCWEKDGLKIPLRVKDLDERFKEIKEMEYKDGDIVIATYPKVGSHWLKDSIGMLMKGKAEISWIGTVLELVPIESYKSDDTRRLAITHLRPDQVSESQKDNAKFIIGIRNPKDAAVSMFCHFHKDPIIQLQGSWDQFFELYSDKQSMMFGWFFDWYRDWQKFIEAHSDKVLVVYYEDMHMNYRHELRRIADFLEIPASDELIGQIADKGQVQTVHDEMMKIPMVKAFLSIDGRLPIYRKGEVGDWKNHFTVAQSELFDTIIEKEMKGLMFKPFVYTL